MIVHLYLAHKIKLLKYGNVISKVLTIGTENEIVIQSHPFEEGKFCNLFDKDDCFKINNANVGITINMKESPKIYTMQ